MAEEDTKRSEQLEAFRFLNPASLTYDEWIHASIAAKEIGVSYEAWDAWCRTDAERYDEAENRHKWDGFSVGGGINGDMLFRLAYNHGWNGTDWKPGKPVRTKAATTPTTTQTTKAAKGAKKPPKLDLPVVGTQTFRTLEDARRLERDPAEQFREFLRINDPGERITLSLKGTPKKKDPEKYNPLVTGELYRVGDLIEDPSRILKAADPKIGAWVAFNTIDPEKWKTSHKADAYCTFRFTLIECDDMEPAKQLEMAARLDLPVVAIVWSGKRSYHFICRVDAGHLDEYNKRVRYMQDVCRANGLPVDTSTKNVNRFCRLPGVMRNGQEQTLVQVIDSPKSYADWLEFVEAHKAQPADTNKETATNKTTTEDGGKAAGSDQHAEDEDSEKQKKGHTISNKLQALKRAKSPLFEALGWDVMQNDIAIRRPDLLPWKPDGPFFGTNDEPYAMRYVQDTTGGCGKDNLKYVLKIIARDNQFNPFIDRLEQVEWDGRDYASVLLDQWLGAEPSGYVRAVSRLYVMEVVCRAIRPGIQADYTPVLKSAEEGIGKTTFCKQLATESRYYVSLDSIRDAKKAGENMRGKLICDLEEAAALRDRYVTADNANSWLTNTTDTYRAAYAQRSEDWPRTACTIITCNSTDWLDTIGQARRFLPVECGVCPEHLPLMHRNDGTLDGMHKFVMQAYAQAYSEVKSYQSAHDGHLPPLMLPPEFADDARKAREHMQTADVVTDTVTGYLSDLAKAAAAKRKTPRVSALLVMTEGLGMEEGEAVRDRRTQKKVAQILDRKAAGWKQVGKQRIQIGGSIKQQTCWEYRGLKPGNGPDSPTGTATTTTND